jgi:hypothetical protein
MPYLIGQPLRPANGNTERSPAIMARPNSSAARIADLPWGQMTQFITRLNNAGLTGDDIKKLLDNPELLIKMVKATKSLLAEPTWGPSLYYGLGSWWNTIAPGVQVKRPESRCYCCFDTHHILVRVKSEGCSCNAHYEETLIHPSDQWADVAPGVQIQKCHESGIAVRTLTS